MRSIYNFRKISEQLSCSGQPTEEQLKQLADDKYMVIVNLGLLNTKYSLPHEDELVESLGMDYHHIPVLFDNPQISELADFINYMDGHSGKKTIVHCAANYRASVFTGLYLFAAAKLDEKEMQEFIEDVWQPDAVWQQFLEEGLEYIKER
jgi:protein tyrosine phosphatase (PTP) superfamily phosphohydrolase (DUF442 family)